MLIGGASKKSSNTIMQDRELISTRHHDFLFFTIIV